MSIPRLDFFYFAKRVIICVDISAQSFSYGGNMFKIIARTVFYQWFFIAILALTGFLLNIDWCTKKAIIINRFIHNAFFPVQWDDQMEKSLKNLAAFKLWLMIDCPDGFEIIEDSVYANQEWYWAKFKYLKDGKVLIEDRTTRIRWKTWEYYYDLNTDAI